MNLKTTTDFIFNLKKTKLKLDKNYLHLSADFQLQSRLNNRVNKLTVDDIRKIKTRKY